MRIVFIVGNPAVQRPAYATVCLAFEAFKRGATVEVVSADGLQLSPNGALVAHVQTVAPAAFRSGDIDDRAAWWHALIDTVPRWVDLTTADLVILRLLARPRGLDEDDGRYDTYYRARIEAVLAFAQHLTAVPGGPRVVNDPVGLLRFSGKLFGAALPAGVQPPTLISRDQTELLAFIAAQPGPTVLKPLMGHGGENVFRVTPTDDNLRAILTTLGHDGYIVAQPFLADPHNLGERRLLLLDGAPIRDPANRSRVAIYRRSQTPADWRGNVHTGASTSPAELTPADLAIVEQIAPTLRAWGLRLVGIDLVADKLLEVNAFCPGGIALAHQHAGFDPAPLILDALLDEPARSKHTQS